RSRIACTAARRSSSPADLPLMIRHQRGVGMDEERVGGRLCSTRTVAALHAPATPQETTAGAQTASRLSSPRHARRAASEAIAGKTGGGWSALMSPATDPPQTGGSVARKA